MNLKTDEITKVIQDQIKNYGAKTKQDEIGYVIQVGDGIAKVTAWTAAGPTSCSALTAALWAWR